jgi:hypothetical protein
MARAHPSLSAKRAESAFEHAVAGKTEREIVALLEQEGLGPITKSGVHRMLMRTRQRLFEELRDRADHQKTLQTARLEKLYREALEAWHKSWKPNKTLTSKQGAGSAGLPQDASVTIRDATGDPRYLQAAIAALADIRAIWGLEEAKKMTVRGDPKAPLESHVTVTDPIAEARRIAERLRAERIGGPGSAGTNGHSDSSSEVVDST